VILSLENHVREKIMTTERSTKTRFGGKKKEYKRTYGWKSNGTSVRRGLSPINLIFFGVNLHGRGSRPVIPPPLRSGAPPPVRAPAPSPSVPIPIPVPVPVLVIPVFVTVVSFAAAAGASRAFPVARGAVGWRDTPIVAPDRRRGILGPLDTQA